MIKENQTLAWSEILFPSERSVFLSVIVPAYNEAKRLSKTLGTIRSYLARAPYKCEIIVVNDGSSDRTARLVKTFTKRYPNISLIDLEQNKGKGYAVKEGILKSRGNLILFTDADSSTPIEEVEKLIHAVASCDIAIGSRYLDRKTVSVKQPFYRIFVAHLANLLTKTLLLPGIKDPRCGFKLFRRESALHIVEKQEINRWGFDMEMLSIAKINGYSISEVPVKWAHNGDSKVRVIRDVTRTFGEFLKIKMNIILGKYSPKKTIARTETPKKTPEKVIVSIEQDSSFS